MTLAQSETQQPYFYGTGKRKTAIARVRLYPTTADGGPMLVNGKLLDEYFNWSPWQVSINEPFRVTNTGSRFQLVARVTGGGGERPGRGHPARHRPRPDCL